MGLVFRGFDADFFKLPPPTGGMSSSDFPIIGIGASAGGIDAFHSLLQHMPADCGMAFVVILHLAGRSQEHADAKSSRRWTPMPVVEASRWREDRTQPRVCPAAARDGHLYGGTPGHRNAAREQRRPLFRPDRWVLRFARALPARTGRRHRALGHRAATARWGSRPSRNVAA